MTPDFSCPPAVSSNAGSAETRRPEIQAVLAERDAVCFRAEKPDRLRARAQAPRGHPQDSAQGRHGCAARLGCLLGTGQARAEDPATAGAGSLRRRQIRRGHHACGCKAGQLRGPLARHPLQHRQRLLPRRFPGHAALYYRRALARDPGHQESRQNLRFIERKYGSITVHRPEYQYALARFPLAAWQGMLWTGAWLCGLAALVFPATRPGARIRVVAVAALAIGPIAGRLWRPRLALFPERRRVRPHRPPSRHRRGQSRPACRCRPHLTGSHRRPARLALRGDPRIRPLGLCRLRHQNPRLAARGIDRKNPARQPARRTQNPQTQGGWQERVIPEYSRNRLPRLENPRNFSGGLADLPQGGRADITATSGDSGKLSVSQHISAV